MVANLINSNGNTVKNQFVIFNGNTVGFQSYNSLICEIRPSAMGFDNVVVLGADWDYSNTTKKHLISFLKQNGMPFDSIKDIKEGVDRGYARRNPSIAIWYDKTMR